jgi:uncharacterized protein DUF4351
LDLVRPELETNRVAALMRIETNETPDALPGLSQAIDDLLPPGESDLRRTVQAWFTLVVRRTFPDAIIPEGMNLKEAPMLEETLIKWRDQIIRETRREDRREALRERREGQLSGMRKVLLKQMTLRFGRLPEKVRRRVEQIASTQDLDKLTRKVLSAKSLEDMGLGS